MEFEEVIKLVGIFSTLAVSLVTMFIARRREKEQQAREDARREKERIDFPQVEFNIDCNFYGPQQDEYLVEVLLTVHNKGHVQHQLKDVRLRIRGIEENTELKFWVGGFRLDFPEKLVPLATEGEAEVGQLFFAEPGEKHVITYVTKIPASIKYILAYAKHRFGAKDHLHDTERVFPVKAR
jgi:hypothetical protein